jgi:hypothetical protein
MLQLHGSRRLTTVSKRARSGFPYGACSIKFLLSNSASYKFCVILANASRSTVSLLFRSSNWKYHTFRPSYPLLFIQSKNIWRTVQTMAEENIWTEEGWSDRRLEKLHNEELHNLYSSPSVIRMTKSRKWAGHVARSILVGELEGKRPLGRLRRMNWMNVWGVGLLGPCTAT